MITVKNKFIGTWRLISCTQTNPDETVIYPWGEDAIGYIIYTEENIMSVQIMRPNRKLFNNNDFMQASAEECHTLPKNYNAYFGTYEINIENETVTHHVEGHLFSNLVGKLNIRHYHFDHNRLSLSTVGGNVKRDMIWEKLSNLNP